MIAGSSEREARSTAVAMPADFAGSLVRPPVLTSVEHGWQHVLLHRFQVPFLDIKLGCSGVHRVTLHLAGRVLVERTREGRHDRRWSDVGCTNLVPAGVPATRSFRSPADFLMIYLDPAAVDEVAADAFDLDPAAVRLTESLAVPDRVLEHFCRLFFTEAESGATGTRLFADTITRGLALHLLRAYSPEARHPCAPSCGMVDWRTRRAIDYMHAHLEIDLPLAQLAQVAGFSPSHFLRTFRAAIGEPPHRHLIRLRIDRARALLERTRMPIIEVARRCGFEQTTHFSTMFRKLTGLTPRAYRTMRGA